MFRESVDVLLRALGLKKKPVSHCWGLVAMWGMCETELVSGCRVVGYRVLHAAPLPDPLAQLWISNYADESRLKQRCEEAGWGVVPLGFSMLLGVAILAPAMARKVFLQQERAVVETVARQLTFGSMLNTTRYYLVVVTDPAKAALVTEDNNSHAALVRALLIHG